MNINCLTNPILRIFEYRKILFSTTYQEIRKKYAGSVLGMAWIVIYPLLFLGVYTIAYGFIFRVRNPNMSMPEYICYIFSGLIIYLGFNESVVSGTQSVVTNSNLIKNTMFPIELVPVRTVLCGQVTQIAALIILGFVLLLMGKWSIVAPFIFVIWFFELLMELGLAWILSALNVLIRDIQSLIAIIMMLLMIASPIAYTTDMIPEALKYFVVINPIYCFIVSGQSVLVLNRLPDTVNLVAMILWGIVTPILGYSFFIKMKGVFIDNV